jgi:hypothetical protein
VSASITPSWNALPPTSPLFAYVGAFTIATLGLGPVFDKNNPLKLSRDLIAYYGGRVEPHLQIDAGQINLIVQSGALTPGPIVDALCCMTLNAAYSSIEDRNDHSPVFEFLRHCRNAAAHGNRFHFTNREPSRPAKWKTIELDHTKHGDSNIMQDVECCSKTLAPADVLALLIDVDKLL